MRPVADLAAGDPSVLPPSRLAGTGGRLAAAGGGFVGQDDLDTVLTDGG